MKITQSSKPQALSIVKKGKFSEEAKARMREKAKQRGVARAGVVATKVRQAMKDITDDMTGREDGHLPNGRLVTEALLYERAGVHWTTLSKNRDTYGGLLAEVKAWKIGLTERKPSREDERRSLTDRLNDMKDLYHRLLNNFQIVELELQQMEAERNKTLRDIEKLKQEKLLLEERLRAADVSNVLPFLAR